MFPLAYRLTVKKLTAATINLPLLTFCRDGFCNRKFGFEPWTCRMWNL